MNSKWVGFVRRAEHISARTEAVLWFFSSACVQAFTPGQIHDPRKTSDPVGYLTRHAQLNSHLSSMNALVALLFVGLFIGFVGFSLRKKRLPLPPGPPAIPIFGKIHHAPTTGNLSAAYWAFREKYGALIICDMSNLSIFAGPVVHFNMFNQHQIVLNSWNACIDLLDSHLHAAIHSDRPGFHMGDL